MKAYIYCRISLDPEGNMLAVDRQEAECRAYIGKMGWELIDVLVDDDLSATSGVARDSFERLLTLEADVVVCWHIDRLVRLTSDLERVIDAGWPVHAIHSGYVDLSTPAGRAVARTIVAWATYEVEQKGLRQKASHVQRIQQGRHWWHSNPPLGYDKDAKIVPEEAALIKLGYEMVENGHGWTAVAREWNARGSRGKRSGVEWTPKAVRHTLLQGKYAGLYEVKGEVVADGQWEPIIDDPRWRALKLRTTSASYSGDGRGKRKGFLTGIAICGACGKTVALRGAKSRNGGALNYYACAHKHVNVPVEALDRWVGQRVLARLGSPETAVRWPLKVGLDIEAASKEISTLRKRLDDLAEAYAEGEITRAQLAKASVSLRARLEGLEVEASASALPHPILGKRSFRELVEEWNKDDGTDEARRALVRMLTEKIVLKKKGRGIRWTPEYVDLSWR